jgi:hypothetical protein
MKPFIGYHFLHGAGAIPPAKAHSRTQQAMSLFTDQKTPSQLMFNLDLQNDQGGPLESVFQRLCDRFGPISNTMRGISMDGGPDYRLHYWNLNTEQFEGAFSLLDTLSRDVPLARERAHIQASWRFKFVDPDTGIVLPDQQDMPVIDVRLGAGSSLLLTTGKTASAYAWFLFPFENTSPEFESYVSRFQKELIFKFSAKHWRLWKAYPVRGWWPKKIVPGWYGASDIS